MIRGKFIATGIEVIGQVTVHGQAVNREQQAVFLITDVADSNFILACGNPPVSVGKKKILRSMSHAMPVSERTRRTQKQQTSRKLMNTKSCRPEHTVWFVRIGEVDRTNTDPRLAKCWRYKRRDTMIACTNCTTQVLV